MRTRNIRMIVFIGAGILTAVLIWLFKPNPQREHQTTGLKLPVLDSINKLPYAFIEPGILKLELAPLRDTMNLSVYLPPSLRQGNFQGSCVAFCLSYELMSYYERLSKHYSYNVKNSLPDFNYVFSPSFVFNGVKLKSGKSDCKDGISFFDGMKFIEDKGVPKWSLFPYDSESPSCIGSIDKNIFMQAQKMKGYTFYKITSTEEMIKAYLTNYVPVAIAIYTSKNMYDDGMNHKDANKPFIWSPAESDIDKYHAMLCVGFDERKKCFILMNSWGKDWGSRGFCYIPYDRFFERAREFYIVKSNETASFTDAGAFKENTKIFDSSHMKVEYRNSDSAYYASFTKDLKELEAMTNRNPDQEQLLIDLRKILKK